MQTVEAKKHITIRDLYPNLSEEELRIAEENLDRYLELASWIYERILGNPEELKRFRPLVAEGQKKQIVQGEQFLRQT